MTMNIAFNIRVFLIHMVRMFISGSTRRPFGLTTVIPVMMIAIVSLPAQGSSSSNDFVTPNFSKSLFDIDSVFLEPGELREVTNALSALAANFPDDSRINNRLKAKALAISLRLDGTHRDSVLTLQKLQMGETPDSIPGFDEPDTVVSGLWKLAEALDRADASRDDQVLACYLMDIAMQIDPNHSGGRVRLKKLSTKGKFIGWKDVIIETSKLTVKPAPDKSKQQEGRSEKLKDNKDAIVDRVSAAEHSKSASSGQGQNSKPE